MRMRPVFLLSLMLSIPLVSVGSEHFAFADAASDEAVTKMARARFNEGVAFDDKGDFENARLSFLQAYALKKHPTLLLNLALTCAKGNHALEASRYFQQFLRESQSPPPDKVKQAEDGLREVRKKLGRIDVTAAPGAEIAVESERVGVAPLADAVDVEPGPRTVTARLADGTILSERVTTIAGQRVALRLGAQVGPGPAGPGRVDPPKVDPPKVDPSKGVPTKVDPAKVELPNVTTPVGTGPVEPPLVKPSEPGLFSPPATLVPVFIGAGVGVAGLISTIIFAAAKSNAQDLVDRGDLKIRATAAGAGKDPRGVCNPPATPGYAAACLTLKGNVDTVNSNATAANISAVVMTVGFVGAAGWYLFGPKKRESKGPTAHILPAPTLTGGGVSVVGTF